MSGATWAFQLPTGEVFPYDDGKQKTFEQAFDHPDVKDTYSIPYRIGPLQPVMEEGGDPGRIRIDGIFRATYGRTEAEVASRLEPIDFLGQRLPVHVRIKPAFERVARRLSTAIEKDPTLTPYLQGLAGTFVWRRIAGTDRVSAHSYGISVDLNTQRSAYWRWQKPPLPIRWSNQVPQAIVDAFEAEGFIWGGRWFHYDTMHFEYRPELLDRACR